MTTPIPRSLIPEDIRAGLLERIGGEWSVGDHVMYRGRLMVGMALNPDDAALVVLAVNTLRRFMEPPLLAKDWLDLGVPCEVDDDGVCMVPLHADLHHPPEE
jgi:hypothetical protein